MKKVKVGEITHYYDKIQVGVLQVSEGDIKVGDKIQIGSDDEGFEQAVDSMQVNHQQVESAKAGDEVGLKLSQEAKEGLEVFKLTD